MFGTKKERLQMNFSKGISGLTSTKVKIAEEDCYRLKRFWGRLVLRMLNNTFWVRNENFCGRPNTFDWYCKFIYVCIYIYIYIYKVCIYQPLWHGQNVTQGQFLIIV